MAMLMLVSSISFTSCEKEPDLSTDQFVGGEVTLLAYGPSPVARGGQLRFIGTGMDQIQSITIEGCGEITEIERVSSEEIRITVPQTAQPCYPVLKTKAGAEIVAKTRLTYTEPVGFAAEAALAPNPVKPGQTLTIKGEYLNLVQKIIFSNKVEVEVDAEKRTREQIEVVVPAEAQTGKVTISFCATGDTIPNEILSNEVLNVVLPSVAAVKELKEAKPGDAVVIEGKDFDLITKLYATSGEEIAEFELNSDFTKLSFKLPDVIVDGIINVEAASGVQVPVASIGVALPKVSAVAGTTDVRAGDIITITGNDFEIASSVTFTAAGGKTVDAVFEEGKTATELKVKVPAEAVTGSFVINTTAGVAIENELLAITTLKPVFAAFNPTSAPLGSDITVEGQNMDLVVKVTVTGGAELEAKNAVPASVMFTLPYANAETGTVTLHMANGESVVTSASLEVTAPLCCYVTAWPELVDGEPYQAGCLLCLEVANRDVLTNVQVDGIECEFVRNGANKIFISTPESAGKTSHIKLISSNGEIDYAYEFKPNTEITTVIWRGVHAAGGWANGFTDFSWGGSAPLLAALKPGVELVVNFAVDPEKTYGCQIRFGNGSWAALPGTTALPGADGDGNIAMADDATEYRLTITQAMIDEMTANGGLVICGAWFILNKISIVEHVSVEVKINGDCVSQTDQAVAWTFPSLMTWDDNGRFRILRNGPSNLGSSVKLGTKIRFYKSGTGQIQVNNPNWSAITYVADWDGSVNPLELVVDQAILDCFTGVTTDGWSETALILQGDGLTIEKITVE